MGQLLCVIFVSSVPSEPFLVDLACYLPSQAVVLLLSSTDWTANAQWLQFLRTFDGIAVGGLQPLPCTSVHIDVLLAQLSTGLQRSCPH